MPNSNPIRIWLSAPYQTQEESILVQEALASNWLAPDGPFTRAFECAIAQQTGQQKSLAVQSGTAALHLALKVLGVQSGDEVCVPNFTFSAAANAVSYLGATPVFIDPEISSMGLDPVLLETYLQHNHHKVKAIIQVHLYGHVADMEPILALGEQYNIPVLEDAAEAFGAFWNGKMAGTWGDIGIYSFNGNKLITTSSGGALVAKDPKHVERATYLAMQAKDASAFYAYSEIGYNYRLSNILAALGMAQLKNIGERIEKKKQIFERYRQAFEGSILKMVEPLPSCTSSWWLSTALIQGNEKEVVQKRDFILKKMREKGIDLRAFWTPLNQQHPYSHFPAQLSGSANYLFERGLCLPSGVGLTEKEQEEVIYALLGLL